MRSKDKLTNLLCATAAIICAAVAFSIFYFLVIQSAPALKEISLSRFFSDKYWSPSPEAKDGYFNLAPMLVASLLVSLLSILISTPLSLACAICIEFYSKERPKKLLTSFFSLLSGIPSVIFGFWGLVYLVPLVAKIKSPGPSLLTGSLVLALMILPTTTLSFIDAIRNFPRKVYASSLALGLSKISSFKNIILPEIKGALAASLILSFMRALGETMVVSMLCGNIVKIPSSLFAPVRTLTANIALEMAYAYEIHRSSLFVSGLLLLLICSTLIACAKILNRAQTR